MPIRTLLTERLGISHPILLAPMDVVADARLTSAVSAAGGLGILGGAYGDEQWLSRELDILSNSRARFGVGFITWSMAKQPKLLDLVLERKPAVVMLSFGDPAPFVERIKRAGGGGHLPSPIPRSCERGGRMRRGHSCRTGRRGGRTRSVAWHGYACTGVGGCLRG